MISKDFFGESKNIEFKREIPNNHDRFLKDIIAFSNSTGGQVILGIEDESGQVYGIGDQSPFKLSDSISNMISDACTPQIEPDIRIQTLEDKTILVIDVAPGKFRPYYLVAKGKETTSYIRINGTSRPADSRKLQELQLEGQNISFDTLQKIGCEYDEEKALDLCREMKKVAVESCKNEEEKLAVKDMTLEKLHDFGILCRVGRNPYPTHCFDLLTDNTNKAAKIQCALFKGITRDIFIDRKEFNGPIYKQVDDAYNFVLRHIDMGAEIEGVYRNDVYELPISAIREIITNANLHRSYLDKSCVQVSIFDDRLEVSSPGMLYGGLDIETAKAGKSTCRNEALAEAFHYMHIAEAWGTGLPRILSRCKEYGLREPLFEEFGDGFKVILFRKVGNASQKIGNASQKVGNASQKIGNAPQKVGNAFEKYQLLLREAGITDRYINNIEIIFDKCGIGFPFRQSNIQEWLDCSKAKATKVMHTMKTANVVKKITGYGPGKYEFIELPEDKPMMKSDLE